MDPTFSTPQTNRPRRIPGLRLLLRAVPLLVALPFAVVLLADPAHYVVDRASELIELIREGNPRRCFQTPQKGPCDENLTRWYFDPSDYTCKPFIWGGCDVSPIFKFESGCIDEHCEQYDYPGYSASECYLVPEPGPCTSNKTAWYYDQEENVCKSTYWGGCGGVRPFTGEWKCKKACEISPSPTPTRTPSSTPTPSTTPSHTPAASVSSTPTTSPSVTPTPSASPSKKPEGPTPEQCGALQQSTPRAFTKNFFPGDGNGGYSKNIQAPVLGAHCYHAYCEEKALIYLDVEPGGVVDTDNEVWTPWFSDEGPANFGLCPENFIVTQMQVSGRRSDFQRLKCTKLASGIMTYNETSEFMDKDFSNEGDAERTCPEGSFMNGLACHGAYCDNIRLSCVKTYCGTPTPSPIPTATPDPCFALAQSYPTAFTKNYVAAANGGYSEKLNTPMVGIRCYHNYCSEQALIYLDLGESIISEEHLWTDWFSEEKPDNIGMCPEGFVVSQVQAEEELIDNMRLKCSRLKLGYATASETTYMTNKYVSNEGGEMSCDVGYVVNGIKCTGAYCDNLYLSCVKAFCDSTPETPAPVPNPCSIIDASSPTTVTSLFYSGEDDGYSAQLTTPIVGLNCYGDHCSKKTFIYLDMGPAAKVFDSAWFWSDTFSNEGKDNYAVCPDGYLISRMRVSGTHADNNKIRCSKLLDGYATDPTTSSFLPVHVSEEGTGSMSCPEAGYYLNGLKCEDHYCDNIYLSCVKVYCYTASPSPLPPKPVEACTALEMSAPTDATKNFMPDVDGGYSEELNVPVVGMNCYHDYCEQKKLLYLDIGSENSLVTEDTVWLDWFSEEKIGNLGMCPEGYVVTQMQVSGRRSDYQRLRCSKLKNGVISTNSTSEWLSSTFSNEGLGTMSCPEGKYLNGVECQGAFCDNVRLSCIEVSCGEVLPPVAPAPVDSCTALAQMAPTDQTKNFFSEASDGMSEEVGNGVVGLRCYDAYCEQKALIYLDSDSSIVTDESTWTNWFSEETSNDFGQCPSGFVVTQMQTSGKNGDNQRLRCSKLKDGYIMDYATSHFQDDKFSNEGDGAGYCEKPGYVVNGVECSGSYCDNLHLSCVRVYC